MVHILPAGIFGSFRPLASETEKASIARPTPKSTLLIKNRKFHSIFGRASFLPSFL